MEQELRFMFPLEEEPFRKIEGVRGLRRMLKDSAAVDNVKYQYYKVSQPKEGHIYAKCSKCECRLKYRK